MATLRFGSKIICPIKLISEITLKSLSVIPSSTTQVFTTTQSEAYNKINVSGITAAVDQNIIPENIKKDITILGVTGTYHGMYNQYCVEKNLDSNGVLQAKYNNTFTLDGITVLDTSALPYSNYNNTNLTGNLDLSSLIEIKEYGLYYTFSKCINIKSVDLSSLSIISGTQALYSTFADCTSLESVDLSSLTTVGNYGLSNTFSSCTALTSVDLLSLTTVSSYGLQNCFYQCTSLKTVGFPQLKKVSGYSFYGSFYSCINLTDVYFPALTFDSFGNDIYPFSQMLNNTGTTKTHTLHFPVNLESTVQKLNGYPNFGGSNGYVQLLYDLPAHVRDTDGDLVYDSNTDSYIPVSV